MTTYRNFSSLLTCLQSLPYLVCILILGTAAYAQTESSTKLEDEQIDKPKSRTSGYGYEDHQDWVRSRPEWSRILYESSYGLIVDEHGELYFSAELKPALIGGYTLYCPSPIGRRSCKDKLHGDLLNLISSDAIRTVVVCKNAKSQDGRIPIVDGKLSIACTQDNTDLFTIARAYVGPILPASSRSSTKGELIRGGDSLFAATDKGRIFLRVKVPAFHIPAKNRLCYQEGKSLSCREMYVDMLARSVETANEPGQLRCFGPLPMRLGMWAKRDYLPVYCLQNESSIYLPLVKSGVAVPDTRELAQAVPGDQSFKSYRLAFEEARQKKIGVHAYTRFVWE